MEKLQELREIRKELLGMEFSYRNVQRIMYLIYESKKLFECASPIPNKEIAMHQINKVIKFEVNRLITSKNDAEVQLAFNELSDNFKLVLAYIA